MPRGPGCLGDHMIEIDFPLLAAQVVSFLVALFILWRFFWGPLTQMIEKRRSAIAKDIEDARQGREDAESLKHQYEQHLLRSDQTAKNILHAAIDEGHVAKEDILKAAREQAAAFLANAKDEITFEKDLAMKDLRKETVDLAVLIAEKILKQAVDEGTRRRMLDEFIEELKNE